jgi:hypothetical protein
MTGEIPTIRQLSRWLRRTFPVGPNIGHVRSLPFVGDVQNWLGYTTIHGNIKLNSLTPLYVQHDSLIHEWAHARVGWNREPHTQAFWIELGRITNAFHRWWEKED